MPGGEIAILKKKVRMGKTGMFSWEATLSPNQSSDFLVYGEKLNPLKMIIIQLSWLHEAKCNPKVDGIGGCCRFSWTRNLVGFLEIEEKIIKKWGLINYAIRKIWKEKCLIKNTKKSSAWLLGVHWEHEWVFLIPIHNTLPLAVSTLRSFSS